MRRLSIAVAALAVLAAALYLTAGPPAPLPPPPSGAFTFAVLGDTPYYPWERWRYRLVRQDLDQHDLAFVIHVGDIFWQPCSDDRMRQALDEMNALRHPVIYTPGDNEWTDCWEPRVGGYAPLERLATLRRLFFADPSSSVGGRRIALDAQSTRAGFEELVEHARWTHGQVVFATFNLPGSRNAMDPFPARAREDDEAAARRTTATVAWLRETFARARATGAPALVLAFHANPDFEGGPSDEYRQAYAPFVDALEEEAAAFPRPILLLHGDDHEFVVDRPLVRHATGQPLAHVTRMQVPGSPDVGWVRVEVQPGEPALFGFQSRISWSLKYW